jgi:hypothetical protein
MLFRMTRASVAWFGLYRNAPTNEGRFESANEISDSGIKRLE